MPLTGERTVPDVPEENYWEFTADELVGLLRGGGLRSTWIGGLHAGRGC